MGLPRYGKDPIKVGAFKTRTLSRDARGDVLAVTLASMLEQCLDLQKEDGEVTKGQKAILKEAQAMLDASDLKSTHTVMQLARRVFLWDPNNRRKEMVRFTEDEIRPLLKTKADKELLTKLQNPGKNDVFSFNQLRLRNNLFESAEANKKWRDPRASYVYPWFSLLGIPADKKEQLLANKRKRLDDTNRTPSRVLREEIDAVYVHLIPDVVRSVAEWEADRAKTKPRMLRERWYQAVLAFAAASGRRLNEVLGNEYVPEESGYDFLFWPMLSKDRGDHKPLKAPVVGADSAKMLRVLDFIRAEPRPAKEAAFREWCKGAYPSFDSHVKRRAIYARRIHEIGGWGFPRSASLAYITKEVLGHSSFSSEQFYRVDTGDD